MGAKAPNPAPGPSPHHGRLSPAPPAVNTFRFRPSIELLPPDADRITIHGVVQRLLKTPGVHRGPTIDLAEMESRP